jgi:hypothetical protein
MHRIAGPCQYLISLVLIKRLAQATKIRPAPGSWVYLIGVRKCSGQHQRSLERSRGPAPLQPERGGAEAGSATIRSVNATGAVSAEQCPIVDRCRPGRPAAGPDAGRGGSVLAGESRAVTKRRRRRESAGARELSFARRGLRSQSTPARGRCWASPRFDLRARLRASPPRVVDAGGGYGCVDRAAWTSAKEG